MSSISSIPHCSIPAAPSIPRPQIIDHPVYAQMRALPEVDDDKALRAAIIYLDLFEKKSWWGVDFRFNEDLSSILIFGSPSRNGGRHVIVPVAMETKLTIRTIRLYLLVGDKARDAFYSDKKRETLAYESSATSQPPSSSDSPQPSHPTSSSSPSSSKKVTLAIVSRDATLVYYQIADGLLRPQRPLTAAQRLQRDALKKMGTRGGMAIEERVWVAKKQRTEEIFGDKPDDASDAISDGDGGTDGKREGTGVERTGDGRGEGGGDGENDWADDAEGFWD